MVAIRDRGPVAGEPRATDGSQAADGRLPPGLSGYRLVEMKNRPRRTTIDLYKVGDLQAANSRRIRKARIAA
jgi:hypothetical protein